MEQAKKLGNELRISSSGLHVSAIEYEDFLKNHGPEGPQGPQGPQGLECKHVCNDNNPPSCDFVCS